MVEVCTFLGLRADGVATVVDLLELADDAAALAHAAALLREHASCETVEIWREETLVRRMRREGSAADAAGSRSRQAPGSARH